jgi:hypothetical protein
MNILIQGVQAEQRLHEHAEAYDRIGYKIWFSRISEGVGDEYVTLRE